MEVELLDDSDIIWVEAANCDMVLAGHRGPGWYFVSMGLWGPYKTLNTTKLAKGRFTEWETVLDRMEEHR